MISMWDGIFQEQDPEIESLLETGKGSEAYEKMHLVLDRVWRECARLLVPGGIACINIGDATRRLGEDFRLYSNHSRCVSAFENIGFQVLPPIFWRKSTNAPNKFMGSGMLPPGAYVTLEHEYILLFRKGGKAEFHLRGGEKEKAGERLLLDGTEHLVLRCVENCRGAAESFRNRRSGEGQGEKRGLSLLSGLPSHQHVLPFRGYCIGSLSRDGDHYRRGVGCRA